MSCSYPSHNFPQVFIFHDSLRVCILTLHWSTPHCVCWLFISFISRFLKHLYISFVYGSRVNLSLFVFYFLFRLSVPALLLRIAQRLLCSELSAVQSLLSVVAGMRAFFHLCEAFDAFLSSHSCASLDWRYYWTWKLISVGLIWLCFCRNLCCFGSIGQLELEFVRLLWRSACSVQLTMCLFYSACNVLVQCCKHSNQIERLLKIVQLPKYFCLFARTILLVLLCPVSCFPVALTVDVAAAAAVACFLFFSFATL